MGAFTDVEPNLDTNGNPERITGEQVSPDVFPLLGAEAYLGRVFRPGEDQPGNTHVAILSYGLWKRRFGGDPHLLGQDIVLSDVKFAVVGVMPRDFQFPVQADPVQIWIPLAVRDTGAGIVNGNQNRGLHGIEGLARLAPGVTLAQAQSDLDAIARNLRQLYPDTNREIGARVNGMQDQLVGDTRLPLLSLLIAVGFLLLVTVSNLANLFLARSLTRQKERAIRLALGARPSRVLRGLVVEGLVLSLAGATLGLVLARWITPIAARYGPSSIPRLADAALTWHTALFAIAVALLAGTLLGTVAALQAGDGNLHDSLQDRGPSATRQNQRLRDGLLIAQIGVATVLLVAGGLMIKSFIRLLVVDPGLNPANVLTASVVLPDNVYPQATQQWNFFRRSLEMIRTIPGVRDAAGIFPAPFAHPVRFPVTVELKEAAQDAPRLTHFRSVTPDYFRALGIPLFQGREFSDQDDPSRPAVAIVNRTMARQYFGHYDPIGQRVTVTDILHRREMVCVVVGVVGDVRHLGLDAPPGPELYVPFAQDPFPWMRLMVKAEMKPDLLVPAVRKAILAVDPHQPIAWPRPIEDLLAATYARRQFQTSLLAFFALSAVLVAALGVYVVISYFVSGRIHEFGVRMALGARALDVLQLVVGRGLRLSTTGVVLGCSAAAALMPALSSLLFAVRSMDLFVYAGVGLLFVLTAILASYIPARRAMRVDPMVAVRCDR
jgi:putative ABC transport system permease protein